MTNKKWEQSGGAPGTGLDMFQEEHEEQLRLADIYRRLCSMRSSDSRLHRQPIPPEATAFFNLIFLFFFWAMLTELYQTIPIWQGPWPFPHFWLQPLSPLWLVLLCLVDAILIDRYLAGETIAEHRFRFSLRLLRFFCCGIPLLGFFVIPMWAHIQSKPPSWAIRQQLSEPDLLLYRPRWRTRLVNVFRPSFQRLGKWIMPAWIQIVLLLMNLFLICMTCGNLKHISLSTYQKLGVCFFLGGLHLVGGAVAALLFWRLGLENRFSKKVRVGMASLSLFWVIPVIGLPFIGLIALMAVETLTKKESLLSRIMSARAHIGSKVEWEHLEKTLRDSWRNAPFRRSWVHDPKSTTALTDISETLQRRLSFFRLKSFILIGEVALISWAIVQLGPALGPEPDASVTLILGVPVLLSVFGGGLAFLWRCFSFFRLVIRGPDYGSVTGSNYSVHHILITQLGLLAGIYLGVGIENMLEGEPKLYGGLLLWIGGFILICRGLSSLLSIPWPFLTSREHGSADTILWVVVGFTLAISGLGEIFPEEGAHHPELRKFYILLVALSPMLGFIYGCLSLRWLSRPFGIKRIVARGTPIRLRIWLGLTGLMALIPLGSLLIPIWVFLERRGQSTRQRVYQTLNRDQVGPSPPSQA